MSPELLIALIQQAAQLVETVEKIRSQTDAQTAEVWQGLESQYQEAVAAWDKAVGK